MNTRTTKDGPFCWASKEARHRIRHRFSQSNSVCSALGIYAALCELASDACAESFVAELPLIANVAGVGKRTAQTILPELVALGVLAIKKRNFPGTNMDAPSIYTLLSVLRFPRFGGQAGRRAYRKNCPDAKIPSHL